MYRRDKQFNFPFARLEVVSGHWQLTIQFRFILFFLNLKVLVRVLAAQNQRSTIIMSNMDKYSRQVCEHKGKLNPHPSQSNTRSQTHLSSIKGLWVKRFKICKSWCETQWITFISGSHAACVNKICKQRSYTVGAYWVQKHRW